MEEETVGGQAATLVADRKLGEGGAFSGSGSLFARTLHQAMPLGRFRVGTLPTREMESSPEAKARCRNTGLTRLAGCAIRASA